MITDEAMEYAKSEAKALPLDANHALIVRALAEAYDAGRTAQDKFWFDIIKDCQRCTEHKPA